MRFRLDIRPAARSCIDQAALTRGGRLSLYAAINDLAEIPDDFRNDPANRSGPFFIFLRAFMDSGVVRQLRLIVDDGSAAYGVLRIVYADLQ
jgi:hypothetical protein